MKKRKIKIRQIIVSLLIITVIFILFFVFINDNVKNNYLLSNINDLNASILKITSLSFIKEDNNYNKEIKKEINNDYQKELKKLKEILELNKLNSDKKLVNAIVIKRSTNYWYNNVTIDKGKNKNIKVEFF